MVCQCLQGGYWGTFASRGYWGTFLVFLFLIWQCMKLATKEATTRTPENRQESMREINHFFQLRWGSKVKDQNNIFLIDVFPV